MELNKKVKILTWLLAFIVLFNVSALTFIILEHHHFHNKMPNFPNRQGHPRFHEFFSKQLDLTPEQQLQYDNMSNDFFAKGKNCMDSIRYFHKLIDDEIVSDNPDTVKINSYIKKISYLQERMQKRYVDYFIAFKKILTPEQQKQFNQLYIDLKQKRFQRKHNFNNR